MNRVTILLMIFFIGCKTNNIDLSPGVSWELASYRAKTISNVRYEISLKIPDKVDSPIIGLETIRFNLLKSAQDLVLDFRQPSEYIQSIEVGQKEVQYLADNQHIIIDKTHFVAGENSIKINFRAGDMSLNRNDEFLYTLFVPDRAATAIPCFDQPNLKGRYTLTLDTPKTWTALTNGPLIEEIEFEERRLFRFGETKPVSTYILAFAAGKFEKITEERNGRKMTMYHRETDSVKVARNKDAIFDLHMNAISWMEDYTGIKYPFQKFDFALIPGFQYGGMEHPGAIFYKDVSLFLETTATTNQYLSRAGLISHETAHMWFGDLVTMNWFDDVWTKEVFAGFMGGKIINPAFPEINHDLRFLSNYSSAYGVDRSAGANQIRQPLENLNLAGTLYGSIIYAKAPVIMKHLEILVGEETFQKGMQTYLQTYSYTNATWHDLIKILDNLSEENLTAWSKIWVDEPDRPIIDINIQINNDGLISRLKLKQSDVKKKNRLWGQNLKVRFGYNYKDKVLPVYLKGRTVNVSEAKGLPKPNYILPNGAGIGYGYFKLDKTSRSYLIKHLPEIDNAYIRGVAWLNLWDDMLYGLSEPMEIIRLCINALQTEDDILNIQRILGRINSAYWSYLSQDQRNQMASELELKLRSHIAEAESISMKSTFFRTLRSVTLTKEGYKWLKNIWLETDSIPGLQLSERDYIAIASELALRANADSDEILLTQLKRINNPDQKARFSFIMPALSNNQLVRDEFFESIKKEHNRSKEPWVQSAIGYLHHPLRARSSEKYIRPSLELLEEIQQTGDIFFPARFVSATLSGYQTKSAANIVKQFLDENQNYSPQLKLKILQAADGLFRSAEILN